MSLVDYASSDDDVPEDEQRPGNPGVEEPQLPKHESHTQYAPANRPTSTPNQPMETKEDSSVPTVELPDATLLLNSPSSSSIFSGSDQSSRVAAATAANTSRKRETNISSSLPRSKVPRSTLRHSKNVPDTLGRSLVPPQLTGRSNIVTEDINKLFVKKSAKPSSQ